LAEREGKMSEVSKDRWIIPIDLIEYEKQLASLRAELEVKVSCVDYKQKTCSLCTTLKARAEQAEAENAELREKMLGIEGKYNDLIMAVSNKYPAETRHETAKRYIIERETNVDNAPKQAIKVCGGK
jgi:hypothetical protein